MVEVDAKGLRDAGKALEGLERNLQTSIRDASRTLEPEWKRLVTANASTKIEQRLIAANARATSTESGVRLQSSGGRVRNGLNAAEHGGAVEFGVKRGKKTTYRRRSRRGGAHRVTRVTTNQLRPFRKAGYVFTPAVKAFFPKLARAWNEAFATTAEDALNGKG